MMQTHHLMVGDRLPPLEVECRDANGIANLTGATAVFFMESEIGTTKINGSAASVLANGRLRYSWGASDTNVAGTYRAWFRVTKGGLQWSFPNRGRDGELVVKIAEGT
jgi:hypothetical protein